MGLFTQRPEEPSEWAGLPAEPMRARPPADLLTDDVAGSGDATALIDAASLTSIPITMPASDVTGEAPPHDSEKVDDR